MSIGGPEGPGANNPRIGAFGEINDGQVDRPASVGGQDSVPASNAAEQLARDAVEQTPVRRNPAEPGAPAGVRAGQSSAAARRDVAVRGQLNQRAAEYENSDVAAFMKRFANVAPNTPESERCEICSNQLVGAFEAGLGLEPPASEEMKTLA